MTGIRAIVIVIILAVIGCFLNFLRLKLVWGDQVRWNDILILGPPFIIITVIGICFLHKKKPPDNK